MNVHGGRPSEPRDEQVSQTIVESQWFANLFDHTIVHDDDAIGHRSTRSHLDCLLDAVVAMTNSTPDESTGFCYAQFFQASAERVDDPATTLSAGSRNVIEAVKIGGLVDQDDFAPDFS